MTQEKQFWEPMLELVLAFPLRFCRLIDHSEAKITELWYMFCAEALQFVKPGRYGTPLQSELCRLTRQVSVVFPIFREVAGDTQVLLRLRKADEPYGGVYCPEANVCFVWEVEEVSVRRMLERLGVSPIKLVELAPAKSSIKEVRGCEWMHVAFYVEVSGEPSLIDGRQWFSLKNLPPVVEHHRVAITAADGYRRNGEAFDAAMKAAREAIGL